MCSCSTDICSKFSIHGEISFVWVWTIQGRKLSLRNSYRCASRMRYLSCLLSKNEMLCTLLLSIKAYSLSLHTWDRKQSFIFPTTKSTLKKVQWAYNVANSINQIIGLAVVNIKLICVGVIELTRCCCNQLDMLCCNEALFSTALYIHQVIYFRIVRTLLKDWLGFGFIFIASG